MSQRADEFKRLWLGEFVISERERAIQERLQQYYDDTPSSMLNKEAMIHWQLFKSWCRRHDYSQVEINAAKRSLARRGEPK